MRMIAALIAAALASVSALPAIAATVASPDGRIVATIDTDGEGIPFYSVTRDGKPIVAKSQLGFNFTDRDQMRRNFKVEGETRDSADTRWEQPWGERRFVRDHHNELALTLRENGPAARLLRVRMRVFDDGLGFRLEFPEQPNFPTARIAEELTEFNLAKDGTAWWIQGGDWNRYEYLYHRTPVSAVSMAHTPITVRYADGTHLSFHEAALVDYSGMWMGRMDGTRFRTTLSPSSRGAKVVRDLPFTTPWRTIRIAPDAAGLFASDLELNLNEPNKLGDVSWFKPQKYIGVWWEMHLDTASWNSGPKHGATTANTMRYIDFAAKHGFRGVLVEGWNIGWDGIWFGSGRDFSFTQPYPDFDIEKLSTYARSKGVRLIGHHETGGNIANYESQLEPAMALYERLGIDAVKTGYVADAGGIISRNADIADPLGPEVLEWHDGQRQVQHHLHVVKVAAQHHIAVNAHEPVKDTGLRRTYPNWVAREGARGAEYDAWGTPKNLPDHVPNLIFTRMLAGPMDYTPGVFSLTGRGGTPIPSTLARQLAYYIVIYSPIQMAADLPENLAKYPAQLKFVSEVPADWADSRLLSGAVGEFAVIARKDRNSDAWYVGGVTDAVARETRVDLSFLDKGRSYTARIYRDGPKADGLGNERHDMVIETRKVRADDAIIVPMARAGGFAISLTPAGRK